MDTQESSKEMEHSKAALEELFKFDRQLLGAGYDNALEYINHLFPLDILEFPSSTEVGTWKVPEEWIVRDAWVKFNGEKILDYKENPLSLVVYSLPFSGKVTRDELVEHLHHHDTLEDATPYVFKFYDRDWGFCGPRSKFSKKVDEVDEKWETTLEEGEYEVFIDSEFKPGVMKLGVHTIPGESDREILLFAHLDHPHQANDNLSGVACLLDIASRVKSKYTIKIVFCPETIGSMIYSSTQDLSKVEFVMAVDICGNRDDERGLLFQKTWNDEDRINRVVHCALQIAGKTYRKGKFRTSIGSDESPFCDPRLGIPAVMFSTWPYPEYHSDQDTPEKIDYTMIKEMADLLLKVIEIWEKDYIPERLYTGLLMRSRYGIQSGAKRINLNWDYLNYYIDGKKTVAEISAEFEQNFDTIYELFEKIINDKKMRRLDLGEKTLKETPGKKRKGVSRKTDVAGKHGEVS